MEHSIETVAINTPSSIEESLRSAIESVDILASTAIEHVVTRVRAEVEPTGEIASNLVVAKDQRRKTLVDLTVLHERAGTLRAEVSLAKETAEQVTVALGNLHDEYMAKLDELTEELSDQFDERKKQYEQMLMRTRSRQAVALKLLPTIELDASRAQQSVLEIDQYIGDLKKLAVERAGKLSEFVLQLSDINHLGDVPSVPDQFEPDSEIQLVMTDLNEWLDILEPGAATTSVNVPTSLVDMPAQPVGSPRIGVRNAQEEKDVLIVEPVCYSRFAPVIPRSGRVIINQEEAK